MRLIAHHHHHHHHRDADSQGKKNHRNERKGRRILKKMAKLERKLEKYSLKDTSSGSESAASSRSNSRSRSPSRSRNKRRNSRNPNRDFGPSDPATATETDSDLSDSASSKSVSGHESPRRPTSRTLPRSRSSGALDDYSVLLARKNYRQRHSYHLQHRDNVRHHYRKGILGYMFRKLDQSEPNQQTISTNEPGNEVAGRDLHGVSSSGAQESEAPGVIDSGTPETEDTLKRKSNAGDAESSLGDVHQGSKQGRFLTKDALEIIQNGLPLEKKEYLLSKYQVDKNSILLEGPKLNEEIVPVATKTAIKSDALEMYEQNQIGAALVALGQAICDLADENKLKKDENISNILSTLNEAAAIFLDAQHNITLKRQSLMLPELKKKIRSIVKDCRADEWLYGNDFEERIKNAKIFRKRDKLLKKRSLQQKLCDKKEMHKLRDKDGERLIKCLNSLDLNSCEL